MARFDRDDAVEALAAVGTQFVSIDADDVPAELLAAVLAEGERQARAVAVLEPPAPGDEDSGMGAWHVNARDEAHLVCSGSGVVQVVTPSGMVTAWVGAGDVMIMRGAEHRYRPLTTQEWVIRHAGPADADLGAVDTGRAAQPWPT